jgi:phage-related protein
MGHMDTLEKPIAFRGSALGDLKAFSIGAKREAGFQLSMIQMGHDPVDWKPMSSIGSGVREIRIREAEGAFRVIYVAKLEAAIYVLHCFQKKTQATSQKDIALATQRYRDLIKEFER